MSLQHFFLRDQVLADEADGEFALALDADDLKHALVLRLAAGEHIAVIDADADYFECEVVECKKSGMRVRIAQHLDAPRRHVRVTLAQGLAKGTKMDEVIRHATELGVSAFIPLACERSVMKLDVKQAAKKIDRWRAIAKSAAMQSGQPEVPEVREPMKTAAFAKSLSEFDAVCVCWEEADATRHLADALARVSEEARAGKDVSVAIVVGPEGGLSEGEVDALLAAGDKASLVSLGSSILRTETAGVVAPALALYELGLLGG